MECAVKTVPGTMLQTPGNNSFPSTICRGVHRLHNISMTVITKELLTSAISSVGAMNILQREQLADEIHANQPQLLGSVLALRSFGVNFEQLDVPLNVSG